MDYEVELEEESSDEMEIHPLKDHVLKHNEFYYEIKKDEPITVNKKFLEVLKSEQVIN